VLVLATLTSIRTINRHDPVPKDRVLRATRARAMPFIQQPSHLLADIFAGDTNREQERIIDYLRTEAAGLREELGPAQRRPTPATSGKGNGAWAIVVGNGHGW
jgi:hypothetical protein